MHLRRCEGIKIKRIVGRTPKKVAPYRIVYVMTTG